MDSATTQKPRFETIKTNVTRWAHTKGVDAVTVYNSNPYFFLFCDIDTHSKEELRKVLTTYKLSNLTVYWWRTSKGYNTVSPCLLSLRQWIRLTKRFPSFVEYSFDTIRLSNRLTDGRTLFCEQWNRVTYLESYSLIFELLKRFNANLSKWRSCYVTTKLQYSFYNQLLFRNMPMRQPSGSLGKKLSLIDS